MAETTIMTLSIAPVRRFIGVVTTGGLGLLLLYISMAHPPQSVASQLFLVFVAILAGWQAWRLWQSGDRSIHLTEAGLFLDTGEVIAPLDLIRRVDRGLFAFKPSNGFLVVLTERAPRGGDPGLWWRIGRRVGIGGSANAREAKGMAEILQTMIAQRDGTL
ncbi:MAG: hypothetical protein AAFV09_09800 [Pseudomonadota bacterium]